MTRCGMDAETAVKAIRSGRGSKYMYRGERKTLEQIAVISGVSMEKLYRRIHEHGASADEAADPNYCGLRYTLYGEKVSLQMAARHCAIPIREIRARLAAEGNPTALDDVISALREERRNKRPETAPAQECEEKPKPQGVARARDMLGNLFPPNVVRDEMRTVQEGRLYRISRDFLDYEARLDERGEARLIVLDRNTGRVWFDRSF